MVDAFAAAAARYWLGVFPLVTQECRYWQRRAGKISDPLLRHHALETLRAERGNLEGAAAFAVLAPRGHRRQVVRAAVAFQVTYDYVDSLAEQPCDDPVANGRQLHLALLAALDPSAAHADYYRHGGGGHDGGYLEHLIDRCRGALETLPSYAAVLDSSLRAARRMVAYQSFNHGSAAPGHANLELARWATAVTPPNTGLSWWETAAGAASSLGVFSLFAASSRPALSGDDVAAIESAYFPWIGALHVLLDSLADRTDDLESGHHCLVDHYASIEEAAARIGTIAVNAMHATSRVPQSLQHALIVAAMTSFYLTTPGVATADGGPVESKVLQAMDRLATPTMAVLRARRHTSLVIQRTLSHV